MHKASRQKVLVWDYPIRIFHLLFAFSVSAALILGLTTEEHSPLFAWHIFFGIVAGFLLVVRVLYGILIPGPTSLRALFFSASKLVPYLKSLVSGESLLEARHNPLASLTYIAIFLLLSFTLLTGFNIQKEIAEESHEAFAIALLTTIFLHLTGIAFHTLYHKENVAQSMVDGRKTAPLSQAISSSRPILGFGMLALVGVFVFKLGQSFDPRSPSFTIPWIQVEVSTENGGDDEYEYGVRHERHGEGHNGGYDDND